MFADPYRHIHGGTGGFRFAIHIQCFHTIGILAAGYTEVVVYKAGDGRSIQFEAIAVHVVPGRICRRRIPGEVYIMVNRQGMKVCRGRQRWPEHPDKFVCPVFRSAYIHATGPAAMVVYPGHLHVPGSLGPQKVNPGMSAIKTIG